MVLWSVIGLFGFLFGPPGWEVQNTSNFYPSDSIATIAGVYRRVRFGSSADVTQDGTFNCFLCPD